MSGLGRPEFLFSTRGTTTGGYRAYRVYIDGLPSDAFGYNGLSPEAVAGIEIYPGAHAPIEYGSGPVILVWTKG